MIGVFDSGVGGLSVLQAIRRTIPTADIVYFGDTENAPYGNKGAGEIAELFAMALRRLHAAGATQIVSACNSASVSVHTIPIDLLRLHVFDVVEMVEPTVEALAGRGKRIAILGTNATIRSKIYQQAFAKKNITVETVTAPELAGLIERGAEREELLTAVRFAAKQIAETGVEIVSLSCTHYPFARDVIEEALQDAGSAAELFDPAQSVAKEVAKRFSKEGAGKLRFLLSKESPVFAHYAAMLFGKEGLSIEQAPSIYWALKTV